MGAIFVMKFRPEPEAADVLPPRSFAGGLIAALPVSLILWGLILRGMFLWLA